MKIKLFILLLVFACLGLTSFSSAYNVSCENNQTFSLTGYSAVYFNDIICDNNSQCFAQIIDSSNRNIVQQVQFSVFINEVSLSDSVLLPSGDYIVSLDRIDYCSLSIDSVPTCPTCEDCSSCQGSLGACLEDNISLENMNSSLQDQLSQCLASGGTSCDPEEDEDCYTGAYQLFHVFRQNQGSDFSLPISNNIFLPSGLRAYTDSGVVALAPLTPNDYSLDRESGEILNDLVIKIFYYLAVLLSVMALAYYIKKFLSFTLFPKKD